ncbi:MAG: HAD-IC family P-type ATPase, partial [Patescibacteria group bacterium]
FEDPIKESTIPAITKAKQKGVEVKIITGDGVEVAGAVGKKIGIIKDAGNVITGAIIDTINDENELALICKNNNVFARCTPIHKYKIIKALEKNNRVAFLGEGINDAPALKAAHVGIVVKDASDIARDAADIILLNKSLSVIIDGIDQGRCIVANISKYIKATLTSNFGNFYAIVFSTFLINYLPMLSIQILLLNLLSDFPMMSIATDKVD